METDRDYCSCHMRNVELSAAISESKRIDIFCNNCGKYAGYTEMGVWNPYFLVGDTQAFIDRKDVIAKSV